MNPAQQIVVELVADAVDDARRVIPSDTDYGNAWKDGHDAAISAVRDSLTYALSNLPGFNKTEFLRLTGVQQ